MGVVDAGETPEFLKGDEAHTGGRRTAQHAPSVAMAMDDELGMGAQNLHGRQADRVHADHQALASGSEDLVMTAEHLIETAGEVGGIKNAVAGAIPNIVKGVEHSGDAFGERAVGCVGLELVVFDEVDAGFGEQADLCGSGGRVHANRRLQDGADERTSVHFDGGAGAGTPNCGPG